MRYKRDKVKIKPFNMFFLILTLLIVVIFLVDRQLRPLIHKVMSYQTHTIATDIITNTVYNDLILQNIEYNDIIKLTKNNEGFVSSIETDMIEINKITNKIVNDINSQLKLLNCQTLKISIGTVSGWNILYGRGPDLSFKIQPIGNLKTRLVSKFTSAGVNQTLHQIYLEVNSNLSAVLPLYTSDTLVTNEFLIAQTVIVGNIPDSYTYITGDDREILSKINDYKN